MAAKLARHNRRKVRAVLTYLQSLPGDQPLVPFEQTDAETLWIFALLNRLIAWFIRFQLIFFLVAVVVMGAFWFPLVDTHYTRRCNNHRALLQHLRGPINFTIPCEIGNEDQTDGFLGEPLFAFFTKFCCIVAASMGLHGMLSYSLLPAIEHIHRRRLLRIFPATFMSVIMGSLFNQLASAFATRPLAMWYNLRFHSMLIMQLFGFGLCLFASFIYGVRYASNTLTSNRGRLVQ